MFSMTLFPRSAAPVPEASVVPAVAKTMIAKYKEMSKKARHYASIGPIFAAARKVGISALEVAAPLHPGAIRAFMEAGILK